MNDFSVSTVFKPIGKNPASRKVRVKVRKRNRFGSGQDDVQYTMQVYTSVPGRPGEYAWLGECFDHYFLPSDIRDRWAVEGSRQLLLF